VLFLAIKDDYAAYRLAVSILTNEINLAKSIMSVLTSTLDDIETYTNRSILPQASAAPVESKAKRKAEIDDGDSDSDSDIDCGTFTRKVDVFSVFGEITTVIAMTFAHLDNAAQQLPILTEALAAKEMAPEEDAAEISSPRRSRRKQV
jgi:hypothetical protein